MKINTRFSIPYARVLHAFHRLVMSVIMSACLSLFAFTQATNIGYMYISDSGNVYLNASFTNQATATYQNDGTFYLTGDFINNQVATAEGAGTTGFVGTTLQKITGSQTTTFHDVYLNNTNGVQMNLNTTMNGIISTVSGSLYFNGHALTMGGKISKGYTNVNAFSVTPTSDLIINGKAANGNALYFDTSAHALHDLSVTDSASGVLGDSLNIVAGTSHGTVIVDGSFDAAGFLTLKSDTFSTSRIGKSSGVINGFVTVERYIPARRAWRFLSVPVNNDTLHIRTAWQEGVNNTDPTLNYANNLNPHPGYGTHITWDNVTNLGYDYNTTHNASLKTWIESSNGWSSTTPPTISTLINDYDGYCIFVRGSRAVDLALATGAPADPTVLRITGSVNNKTWSETFHNINPSTILLAKNPYASDVDISSMLTSSTGIQSNKFWVWDPAIGGSSGVGGYVTYTNGIMDPVTANYPYPTTIIQDGQAFLVQSNDTMAILKFKQGNKVDSQKTSIFGKQAISPRPVIYTNLIAVSEDTALVDGVATAYGSNFFEKKNVEDADKLWNFDESIGQVRDGKTFAIQFRPMPGLTDTIFYRMYLKQQPYILQVLTKNFAAIPARAWIVDKYLHTATEIALNDDTVRYDFQANSDTNSYLNRFMLVFKRQFIATPVPVSKATNHGDSTTAGDAASIAAKTANVSIYPNPVITGEKVVLKFNNIAKGNYEVSVYSLTGQKLLSRKIDHNGVNNIYTVRLPLSMAAGTYNLRVISSKGINIKALSLVTSGGLD
jgi:hypothetical protein